MSTQAQDKMAVKFGLSAEEVDALFEADIDTPTKLKGLTIAAVDEIAEGLSSKLSRWIKQ